MAQKLNHYRVVVQKHDGVLVTYDESAVSIEVVIRHALSPRAPVIVGFGATAGCTCRDEIDK